MEYVQTFESFISLNESKKEVDDFYEKLSKLVDDFNVEGKRKHYIPMGGRMGNESETKFMATAQDLSDANLLKGYLKDHGVISVIRNTDHGYVAVDVPLKGNVEGV